QPAVGSNPAITPTWHVFFSQTRNAMSTNPTFAQKRVETNIVHNHSICMNGLGCSAASNPHGEPGNRDLLEYFRTTLDPEGNINIAYADSVNSCDPSVCRTNTWYTKQTTGPSAFAPPSRPAAATFATNLVMPNSTGHAEPNMKADSHNCLFSASPGG